MRAVLAAEDTTDHVGVVRRLAADQLLVRSRRQAELHRVDRERVRAAVVVEREHRRRPGRRQLVEPTAVHHPGVGGTVGAQRRQHPLGEGGVGDADEVAAHPAGIGHRPEQVEDGRDPDLAAGRGGEAERGMEPGGEAEPDARGLHAALHTGRRQLDGDAQLLQDVSGPALRRCAARPVLADGNAGAGDDDGRHRRHVDRVRPVPTGADHVDRPPAQLVVERHQLGGREHRVEQTGQLVSSLPLRPQGDDEPDQLGRGGPPAEDVGHRRARLLGGQVAAGEQLGEQPRPPAVVLEGTFVSRRHARNVAKSAPSGSCTSTPSGGAGG